MLSISSQVIIPTEKLELALGVLIQRRFRRGSQARWRYYYLIQQWGEQWPLKRRQQSSRVKKWDFSDTHTWHRSFQWADHTLRSNESKITKTEWLNIEASELLVGNTLKILSSKGLLEVMSCEVVLKPEMLIADPWAYRFSSLPYTLGNIGVFQTR